MANNNGESGDNGVGCLFLIWAAAVTIGSCSGPSDNDLEDLKRSTDKEIEDVRLQADKKIKCLKSQITALKEDLVVPEC